jgi:hypothetical protein
LARVIEIDRDPTDPMSSANAPLHHAPDRTPENRVLEPARAYAETRLPGCAFVATEFGTPSLGLDDSATPFVAVEAPGTHLLVRVTVFPDGRVSACALTADLPSSSTAS